LKALGIKLLNLHYEEQLSTFAFKFNLRRSNEARSSAELAEIDRSRAEVRWEAAQAQERIVQEVELSEYDKVRQTTSTLSQT
jgi:hypothetical protein